MDQREKDRLIWNLKSLPNEIADLFRDLDAESLRWSPIPGKWSLTELICHLRDSESIAFVVRYKKFITEQNPVFQEMDQNRAAAEGDYLNQDAHAVLTEFKQLREESITLLESLPPDQWDRAGMHERTGPLSVEQLVVMQKEHDLNHLLQMKDIARLKMSW
ncbi:MAG: hypothetical protein DMF61_16505 [Blastocatellia bacterium AA13]|nr:MAG: hypothetical protein DMF61_16505 [Blastocatellia bacterium AA13]